MNKLRIPIDDRVVSYSKDTDFDDLVIVSGKPHSFSIDYAIIINDFLT